LLRNNKRYYKRIGGLIMDTTENNILIAEFMEFYKDVLNGKGEKVGRSVFLPDYIEHYQEDELSEDMYYKSGRFLEDKDLKFNSSWGWLMPVVEKIESSTIDKKQIKTSSESGYAYGHNHIFRIRLCGEYASKTVATSNSDSKIESVYNAVVEFIEWYNTKL
jgi:hypothetical protein